MQDSEGRTLNRLDKDYNNKNKFWLYKIQQKNTNVLNNKITELCIWYRLRIQKNFNLQPNIY